MAIMYLLDKETLMKIFELRKKLVEKQDDYNATVLMQHDAYRKVGRRIKQIKWGK